MVKKQYPNVVVKGKDLFDAVLFSSPDTIQVFFTFMSYLHECILGAHSTQIHKLLKLLKEKKRLLRCYTQNIDGLETHEGLSTGITPKNWKKLDVIQLHGDIHKLKCMHCSSVFDWTEESSAECKEGTAPECPSCQIVQEDRLRRNRRSTGVGRLKPNIVLYGEEHPDGDLIGRCTQSDFRAKPDFLLIAGTSLKVVGIQKLVKQAAKSVKQRGGIVVFVNQTEVGSSSWKDIIDFHIQADCDEWVANLKTRVPDFFSIQTDITSFAKKGAKAAPKKKSTAAATLITPPATPVKQRKDAVIDLTAPGFDMPPTPPSTGRKTRHTNKRSVENTNTAMALPMSPEKTPTKRLKSNRQPLGDWNPGRDNTAIVAKTRKRGAGDSLAGMNETFQPIKRTRNVA